MQIYLHLYKACMVYTFDSELKLSTRSVGTLSAELDVTSEHCAVHYIHREKHHRLLGNGDSIYCQWRGEYHTTNDPLYTLNHWNVYGWVQFYVTRQVECSTRVVGTLATCPYSNSWACN